MGLLTNLLTFSCASGNKSLTRAIARAWDSGGGSMSEVPRRRQRRQGPLAEPRIFCLAPRPSSALLVGAHAPP